MAENRRALWRGDYTIACEEHERLAGRRLFVEAIVRRVPEFLAELDQPYPQYALLAGGPRREPVGQDKYLGTTADFAEIREILDEEQKDGLSVDWDPAWTFEICRDPGDQPLENLCPDANLANLIRLGAEWNGIVAGP